MYSTAGKQGSRAPLQKRRCERRATVSNYITPLDTDNSRCRADKYHWSAHRCANVSAGLKTRFGRKPKLSCLHNNGYRKNVQTQFTDSPSFQSYIIATVFGFYSCETHWSKILLHRTLDNICSHNLKMKKIEKESEKKYNRYINKINKNHILL